MSATNFIALDKAAEINPRITAKLTDDDNISFVPMAALSAELAKITKATDRHFGEVKKGYTAFESGDVLIAKITPCFENGKIAQAILPRQTGFGSTEFHVVRPRPGISDGRYLHHYLRQPSIRIGGEKRMTGSGGQRRVPEAYLASLSVPLPSLPEQRRIAAILDQADALRTQRRQALAELDKLAQAVFMEMFGDPATNPMGWPRLALGELLSRIDSGWSPVCLDRQVGPNEWGVLKLGAVTSCIYDAKANKALPSGISPDPDIEVQVGDLLFSRKNTYELVAACAFVDSTIPKLMMSDLIFRLQVRDESKLNKRYLHALLTNKKKRIEVQKLAGGSSGSMPNISKAKLLGMNIEVPPSNLQAQFAERVEAIEDLKTTHRAALAESDALFASLQHRAFSGAL